MKGRGPILLAALLAVVGAARLLWPETTPIRETTFALTDGRTLHGSELHGVSVLVNFWSVSCPVCLHDMPRLARLHESLKEENFLVVGVALAQDPPPAVIGIVEKLQPGYPIALDVHGEVSRAFGNITVTPTSFLVTPDGRIRYTEHGPLDEERVRSILSAFRG